MSQEREPDIVELFKQAVYEVDGFKLEEVTLDTRLSDLSLSSVALLEVMGHLEQRLEIRFNDEDLARLTSVRDLAALIRKARAT